MSRRKPAAARGGPPHPDAGPPRPRGGLRARARAAGPAVTGTGAAASATLALLVLICTFVAVAVPRASLGYRTTVLQRAFAAAPATQKTVLADGDLSGFGGKPLTAAQLEKARVQLAAGLQRDGLPLAGPATRWQWSGLAAGSTPLSGATAPGLQHTAQPQLELVYRSTLAFSSCAAVSGFPPNPDRSPSASTVFCAAGAAANARCSTVVR